MANDIKVAFLETVRRELGKLRRLGGSQSLYEVSE